MKDEIPRRAFIASMASGMAAVWLAARPEELHAAALYAARTPRSAPFDNLTAEQARELDAISAAIVPTDDTPGAREANVVRFIDRSLSTFAKEQREPLAKALEKIADAVSKKTPGNHSFAKLSRADQDALLQDLFEHDKPTFFAVRGATMAGMFSNPEYGGNTNKVGWKLIGFEDRYSWVPPFGYYDRGQSE
jgi:gluconate 2-dehydrogenase gamma chain